MKTLLFLFPIIFLSGCYVEQQIYNTSQSSQPKWLDTPSPIQDKLSAVGCAYIHVSGENEQTKLAISRAIEQIALQKQAKVSVVTYRTKNATGSNSAETSSLQEVNAEKISTKVIDTYKDKDGRICVLVVEE